MLISDWSWPDQPQPSYHSLSPSELDIKGPSPAQRGREVSREKRGLCRLLEDEHSWGRECMQGLTKWKQSVLHPLNTHGSMLQCVCVCVGQCVCVCVCVQARKNTYQKEEGPLGLCPFAMILIQLYTSCSLPPHLYRSFLLSPRAEDKQCSALHSQWLLSTILPPPLQVFYLGKTGCCFASHGKKYNRKD